MIGEGDATPVWLVNELISRRRRATIVAPLIKLGQKLTDDEGKIF
ncbi:hypothetical protein J2782_004351, partial [Brucella pseudogrignonensis]|nr:hypothetical protein [Brucella pseudogrignonensis]